MTRSTRERWVGMVHEAPNGRRYAGSAIRGVWSVAHDDAYPPKTDHESHEDNTLSLRDGATKPRRRADEEEADGTDEGAYEELDRRADAGHRTAGEDEDDHVDDDRIV